MKKDTNVGSKNELQNLHDFIDYWFSVIPFKYRNKFPSIKWKEHQGKKMSLDDFKKHVGKKLFNIWIATGKISWIVVVDIDQWAEIENLDLPDTVTVESWGGGYHLYYKYPQWTDTVKSNASIVAKHVDIRGDGGCIVAPPSTHKSWNRYKWRKGKWLWEIDLADLPKWVIEKSSKKDGKKSETLSKMKKTQNTTWNRNNRTLSYAWKIARKNNSVDWLELLVKDYNNQNNSPALPEEEINKIISYVTEKFKEDKGSKKIIESEDTYAYIKSMSRYYWKEKKKFLRPHDLAHNLMAKGTELYDLRACNEIKTYDDICYYAGGKEKCLNLLNEDQILLPSETPKIHPLIQELISSVCGEKKENIDYLHKAILYKYLNINDFTIPAVVFYGTGWSGKWSLVSLLWTIFWEDAVLANLWQRDISWSFDTYKGQKLIVEFAELATNNTNSDMKVLNKLKNIIGAEKITVNEKWVQAYQTENIALFFISSNSNKPLQLDDKDKWNRRFTIIRSYKKLSQGKEINETIRTRSVVQNYLAWLHKEYPEVLEWKILDALDNKDKRDLEDNSQHEANNFWEWFEENYPNEIGKKTKVEVEMYISTYCFENNLDEKDFLKYFWNHSKYPKKKIRIWEKTPYGVDMIE